MIIHPQFRFREHGPTDQINVVGTEERSWCGRQGAGEAMSEISDPRRKLLETNSLNFRVVLGFALHDFFDPMTMITLLVDIIL